MANTALTPVKTTRCLTDLAAPVAATEAGADVANNVFANTGRELLVVRNAAGSNKTLIVKDKNGVAGSTQTLVDTKSYVIGPFPVDHFNDTNGNVTVTINSASVNVYVVTIDHPGVLAPSQS